MPSEKNEHAPLTAAKHRTAFFRQSGWLMIANVAGGVFMWAVHFLSKWMPAKEYGVFGAFLAVAMCVPMMPLLMALTHQTALALATGRRGELAGMIRAVWLGTSGLWVVVAILTWVGQGEIMRRWEVTNPACIWISLMVVLLVLWAPLFQGILQGQQNFFWLGWSMMLNGVGRFGVAALAVTVFGAYATGMLAGVLAGSVLAVGIGAWQTRSLWQAAPLPFDWRSLLREVFPQMLGFGAFQCLFSADTMFVKGYFPGDEVGFYISAGVLSRALMWLVGPLATVMFPRIVHSTARAEKSDLMGLVLIGTTILAVVGAVCLSILGPWIVRFVYKESYVGVATAVLPWYAAAMVPLAIANVLLNNLLARSTFKVVFPLCVLAGAYAIGLTQFHSSLVSVLKTLLASNVALLALCSWYTWGPQGSKPGMDKPQAAVQV